MFVRSGTGHPAVTCFTHSWLLASVSAIAMLAVAAPAHARSPGGSTTTQSTAAIAATQSAQIEAQRAARAADGALKRATVAMQAMQAAQKAARDAALAAPGGVPNGLVAGGLQVAPGAVPGSNLWLGARLPTESVEGGRSNVSIEQTQQKAILTWQTFNVGKDTTLYFDQRAGGTDVRNWIALNRVLDPSAAPSKILGSIKADGQVYIVNRNGIIFGGSSQVNVGTLVASSLALTNEQFLSGINTRLTYDPLGNGSIDMRPTFGDVPTTTNVNAVAPAPAGNVTVAAGAQISSGKYGLIGLFGTNVTNSGTLSTDGGQVMMAAGEQVFLVPHSLDSGMIGLRAYVSALPNFYTPGIDDAVLFQKLAARTAQVGMVVRNDGLVEAAAGNITIVGSTVQQNGIARAVTTLDSPGSIMIAGEDSTLWSYFGAIKRRSGTVVFGENSVTQIVVDDSGTVGTGGSAGGSSLLRITGQTVELKGKASAGANDLTGAYVQSQGGKIDIDLRGTEYVFASLNEGFGVQPQAPVAGTRFLMAGGATLDVSGVKDVEVPVERNSVAVEIRANELRDSPLLRGGFLVAKTVYVDRRLSGTRADGTTWRGSPLIDANDYIANVPTSMAERAVKGGSITIHSNEVVIKPDAQLDISGGSIRYLDGYVRTTSLLAANGAVYDIGSAPTDLKYIAFAGGFTRQHARWNVVETWTSPIGRKSEFHFERGYQEGANGGLLEVHAPAQVWDGKIIAGVITGERQISSPAVGGTLKIGSTSIPDSNFHANNLLIQKEAAALPDGFSMSSALPANLKSTLVLSTDMLNESGLAKLDLNVNGNITFASSADLVLAPGSSVTAISYLAGKSVVIDGSIRLPGGSFALSTQGTTTVKSTAIIDVSGLWTNHLVSPQSTPVAVNGGRIELGGALNFETGSVLDVSAGAWLSSARKLKLGSAGSITITARNAGLDLSGVTLRGYGVATGSEAVVSAGGTLTLNLASIAIAPSGSTTGNATRLDPLFFSQGGFSSYALIADSITFADGMTLAPNPQTQVVDSGDLVARPSATGIAQVASLQTFAAEQRPGTALSFKAARDIVLPAGTTLAPGIGGRVSLTGANAIVRGVIDAPAGTITVAGSNVTLESTARLLARGATRITTDVYGRRTGTVLDGGSVNLNALDEIAIQRGALIDVSGTSGVIDVVDGLGARGATQALTLASNGGAINISAAGGMIEGTLIGNPGGPGASGGGLGITLAASGASALDQLKDVLLTLQPSCFGYGSGSCDGQSWQETVGFDLGLIFADFGYEYTPIIFSQALIDAVANGGGILVSARATPSGGVDPAQYGLSTTAFAYLADVFGDISGLFSQTKSLTVRPQAFASGGFAGLSLAGAPVKLDAVNISVSGSISIGGSLLNYNGTSSRLSAPSLQIGDSGAAAAPAAALAGELTLSASAIDVGEAGIRGYARTNINTSDLRLAGGLDVDGNLVITAGQVFPFTQTAASISASQSITILASGESPALPFSAGGTLTLRAPVIDQRGTLRAPFGQIVLDATDGLTLGAGSITSVSGAGLIMPYGTIADLTLWYGNDLTAPLTAPPEKRITLKAPNIDARSGAVIDLSGGGDLVAYQFVPGSGGSSNYLAYGGAVAIMPVSMVSAIDRQQVIHLDGGYGIPAGDYAVLPSSYALLPGAYRLVPFTNKGQPIYNTTHATQLIDGSVVMAGWSSISGTGVYDQRARTYRVSPIETTKLYSEYKIWTANGYFASSEFVAAMRRQSGLEVTALPRLPKDAGALQIEATVAVSLNGTLLGSAEAGGRGAVVDISGDKIAVVGGVDAAGYRAAGYLVLDAGQLSAFGSESLLLGGTRKQTVSGLEVDAVASSIVIATDGSAATALVAPEILLASEKDIDIVGGSIIEARGSVGVGSGNILIKPAVAAVINTKGNTDPSDDIVISPAMDYGAFVRVSNGETVKTVRTGATNTQGTLTIGAASLRGKAIILDATKTTSVAADADLRATALDVSSGRISIGTPSGTPDGLVLSGSSLASLAAASDLHLRSYSSIDFYGNTTIGTRSANGEYGLAKLELDAASLNGATGAQVTIAAGEVLFSNNSGATAPGLGGSGGALVVNAATIALGTGAKSVDGFGRVVLDADKAILGRGTGTVDFKSANLAFAAPLLGAESGAQQDWVSTGTFQLTGKSSTAEIDTLGARLSITAASIMQGGRIDLAAGLLGLRATSGDVILTGGSVTRATGVIRQFFDQRLAIAGGRIALTADQGRVDAMAGSLIDLSGNGAKAGTLAIVSSQAVRLDGALRGDGGGSFTLDTGAVPSFATLADKLAASGFNGDIGVRLRAGDLTIDGTTRASSFSLAADAGSITVTGTIDVSGAAGGVIVLSAKNDLTVAAGARLLANAGDGGERSGLIELSSADGTMDLRAGARIEALGGHNGNGDIKLRFRRDDSAGTVKLVNAAATMTAARIIAEAYRDDYSTTSANAMLPAALADAATFMANHAAAIEASLGRASDPTFHLVPGIELTSNGDLTLSSAVDLHAVRYDGEAGVLTLRAAGNLLLNGSLSDGFASAAATAAVLTDTASWSYRLVGGADLTAANALAVRPLGSFGGATSGSVKLASGTIVRTGTGAIDVAAGYDLTFANQTAVIYTAGARIADASLGATYTGNMANPAFTSGGGDIRISSQNDIRTLVPGGQMIVDWQWRTGRVKTDGSFETNKQTAWWINFAKFQQGIAALGGGNVSVTAGRDIAETSVITVTQGRVGGGRTAQEAKIVAITGGGDLTVAAGRNILGGVYYVDGGTGSIAAGSNITAGHTISYVQPQLGETLVRGVNPQLAIGDAALTVTAGGAIELAGAGNPTQWYRSRDNAVVLAEDFSSLPSGQGYFSTQTQRTTLSVIATGGNVTLWNDSLTTYNASKAAWPGINSNYLFEGMDPFVYYPGTTKIVAASGDINIVNGMLVLPSATGNLDLWAQGSLNLKLRSKESFARLLAVGSMVSEHFGIPTVPNQNPTGSWYGAPVSGGQTALTAILHAGDYEPSRFYAVNGDIVAGDTAANVGTAPLIYVGEQAWFRAGHDIVNLNLRAQNSQASDLTLVTAGRDVNLGRGAISIDGPGFVLVEAGRDVYLGKGGGIETVGNGATTGGSVIYRNTALPRGGADLLVLAGTADGPRYDAFVAAYLDPANVATMASYLVSGGRPIYLDQLVAFMRQATGNALLSDAAAVAALKDPRFADYRKFLINAVLSRELRAAGRGKVDGLDAGLGYERGYAAIATLYPGAERKDSAGWRGDVIMDVSKIRTYLGGNLDITAPGGNLQVSALSSTATGPNNGVLTINGGEIRIFTGVDTIINTSRILTARGGDVTIWASYGDIDAGKGKKSALTNPPVTYALNDDGNISYTINPSFSGSGISTQKGAPDAPISSVDLYAPDGIINAGDAGIRSSGAIYLGALEIRGAENIRADGEIKGVPKQATSVGSLNLETKDRMAADAVKDSSQSGAREQASVIIVEVIGYGGGDTGTPSEEEEERQRRRGQDQKQGSYDPNSIFRVVGSGELTAEQKQKLTREERANLESR